MIVNIDEQSGFCFGVERTIKLAEEILKKDRNLFCLGEIVHNETEISRLKEQGLVTISREEFINLKNTKVLIRSHGEPPETFIIAKRNNIELINGTCPIVTNLQKKIIKSYDEIETKKGQIIIFGDSNHPEVIALKAQKPENTLVINSVEEIGDKINPLLPVRLFSQTTKNLSKYNELSSVVNAFISNTGINNDFKSYNSVCHAVSDRNENLTKFAAENEVIIFIGGKQSSNGKMLFEHCKSINVNSYYISMFEEIETSWFKNKNSVGVCGATSTPKWQIKEIALKIKAFNQQK